MRRAVEPLEAFSNVGAKQALRAGPGVGIAKTQASEPACIDTKPCNHVLHSPRLTFAAPEHRPIHDVLHISDELNH